MPVKVGSIGRQIDRIRVPGVSTPLTITPVIVASGWYAHVVQVPNVGDIKGKVIVCPSNTAVAASKY